MGQGTYGTVNDPRVVAARSYTGDNTCRCKSGGEGCPREALGIFNEVPVCLFHEWLLVRDTIPKGYRDRWT